MPATSKGLRHPASSSAPNVPQDIQNLANDVDALLFTNGGVGGVLAGSAPAAGAALIVKTVYTSVTLNASGDGTVTFPGGAFPNGLLSVVGNHYSPGAAPSNDLEFVPWGATLSVVNVRCYGPTGAVFGGTGVAFTLIAIGW